MSEYFTIKNHFRQKEMESLNKVSIEEEGNIHRLLINDEDHTLGNVLKEELLLDKRVEFAGYKLTHASERKVDFTLRTNDFKNVMNDNLNKIINDFSTILDSVQR